MAGVRFSARAKADLKAIAAYTLYRWGQDQARLYLADLNSLLQLLVATPLLGRVCDSVDAKLRRMEYGKHVVFYRLKKDGLVVIRILHERMLPRM